VNALRDVGIDVISVDACGNADCAAEGAALAAWRFQDLKVKYISYILQVISFSFFTWKHRG